LIIRAGNPPLTKKVKEILNPFSVRSNTQKKNTAQKLAKDRIDALLRTTPELLISGSDDHTLFLWSPFAPSPTRPAHKPITRLTGHQRQVFHVAFAPDGRLAASCSWDGSVRVWEGRTGRFVATLRGHVGPVYRLAWSADGRMLVSASKDSTVKVSVGEVLYWLGMFDWPQIWDLKTYKIKVDLPGHTDEVYCVDYVADKLVSGGRDATVKM
jgi:ribosome assembly protein 4